MNTNNTPQNASPQPIAAETTVETQIVEVAPPADAMAMADLFVRKYADIVAYVPDEMRVYQDGRWKGDPGRAFFADLYKRLVQGLQHEAALDPGPAGKRRMSAVDRFVNSQSDTVYHYVRAPLYRDPTTFDPNPDLLNLANGTLDLATGRCRAPSPSDLITHRLAVSWNPAATCPTYQAFLKEITKGDDDLALYLNTLAYYWLSARNDFEHLHVFTGTGGNGKSVFLGMLMTMLTPQLCSRGDIRALTKKDGERALHMQPFVENRLVVFSETNVDDEFADGFVKNATEKETEVRWRYGDAMTMVVTAKPVLATNTIPSLKQFGPAMRRRLRVVPFLFELVAKEADEQLKDKLRAELDGILYYLVQEGRRGMQLQILKNPPRAVTEATGVYFDELDDMADWARDNLVFVKGGRGKTIRTLASDLCESHTEYCTKQGKTPHPGTTEFNRAFKAYVDRIHV